MRARRRSLRLSTASRLAPGSRLWTISWLQTPATTATGVRFQSLERGCTRSFEVAFLCPGQKRGTAHRGQPNRDTSTWAEGNVRTWPHPDGRVRRQPSAGSLGPADLPAEQDTGAAISAAAKQLSISARGRASLMLAIPYSKRSRAGFEKAEGRSGIEPSEARRGLSLLCALSTAQAARAAQRPESFVPDVRCL
jgi:hypothetical protein